MTKKNTDNKRFFDCVLRHPLSRRKFMKYTGVAAGTAAAAGALLKAGSAEAGEATPDLLETAAGVDTRYSVCLGCHSKCGIRVRVKDDTVLKIDGNPWHPNCVETTDRLHFDDTLATALSAKATVCPKGQAGPEVMHNPFRIKTPLKRVGARGSGKWESITWDQALTEIAEKLKPYYQGYGTFINGESALGHLSNQVAFAPGRLQHGQKELTDRIFKLGFGTVNKRHDHTSICETTHHVAGKFITDGKKTHFKPDMLNSDYILWFGTNPAEANFPGQTLARRLSDSTVTGTKHVIVDPRHSRAAAFAHRWLAVRPGGDVALAMGIARHIIDSNAHDADFLEAGNDAAAKATTNWNGDASALQYNATDATWLVVVKAGNADDEWIFHRQNGNAVLVDPSTGNQAELDRAGSAAAQWGKLELDGGETNAVTAASAGLSGVGDNVLDLGGGVYAAPVFQLYKARLRSHPMSYYAAKSGIDAGTITAVATEFAAAGRKAVATAYRGACQKTNGMATMQAILSLNSLMGNWDWKGGNLAATGGHLHEMGGKTAGQLSLSSQAVTKRSPTGPQITRVKTHFDSNLASALGESFDQPTTRPWFPWAYNGAFQELIPSFEDQYPYPIGVFISYWNNIPYSAPAAREAAFRVLRDETLVPLHVNMDIEMGEMASLADYVLPDGSYFERWSTPHNSPVLLSKFSPFRSPVVGYYAKKVGTNGKTFWQSLADGTLGTWNYTIDWTTETGPFALEDIMMELMSRVAGGLDNFGGFGTNAYYASQSALDAAASSASRNSLTTAWDWYWNILVNWAIETGVSPTDTAGLSALAHKIVERGGWFQDTTDGAGASINEYDGNYAKNKLKLSSAGKTLHLFFEYAYPSSHPDKAGKRYIDPYSRDNYDPLPEVRGVVDAAGNEVDDGPSFPFTLVTYKPMYHSQSRTDSLPSLRSLEQENGVEMNSSDARKTGVWTGDRVRVSSASYPSGVVGKVQVTERIRPGVVAISHSRGRWEINSKSYTVGGVPTATDKGRGKGVASCEVMRLDPSLGNVTLQEPIGGSASFFETRVAITKVL